MRRCLSRARPHERRTAPSFPGTASRQLSSVDYRIRIVLLNITRTEKVTRKIEQSNNRSIPQYSLFHLTIARCVADDLREGEFRGTVPPHGRRHRRDRAVRDPDVRTAPARPAEAARRGGIGINGDCPHSIPFAEKSEWLETLTPASKKDFIG